MRNSKKIRFISKANIQAAYKRGENISEDLIEDREENHLEKIDKLPEETFQIIGKVVSFIEIANKMEEK